MNRARLESKFEDPELLQRAREQSPEPITVLVEVDLPARRVEFEETERLGARIRLPKKVPPPTPEEREEISRKTEEARQFLSEVLGTEPLWLQSARAFVVEATGSQLLSIANFPLTKAIHPNRTLQ